MTGNKPIITRRLQDCLDYLHKRLGKKWIVGAPLGLGKPNHLLNAFYQAAIQDENISLDIFTALSLNPPKPSKGLKQRFLKPFVERQFRDYPRLDYLADLDKAAVPDNISISEFYLRSGSRLGDSHAQRHYVSSNYTHVARDMAARGTNIVVQMVATNPDRPGFYSLGSNPDVTLDLIDQIPRKNLVLMAQLNDDMPYMSGEAEVEADVFDLVLENHPQPLFAVPRMPVSDQDYLIGLRASQLIKDGGTLQLGIGSLGDAVCYFTVMRHQDNDSYCRLINSLSNTGSTASTLIENWGGNQPFKIGLYAASEMFMEGFLHLYQAKVLKRRVFDHAGIQTALSSGKIHEELRSDTIEVLWSENCLPEQLDDESLARLLHFGILENVRISGKQLKFANGVSVSNDLTDADHRQQISESGLGSTLQNGALVHAAFFLGSQWMYDTLNGMNERERSQFQMTRVSRVNQLYGGEVLDRVQRKEARFINTTMKMTLLGAAASDQLSGGQVVSGVGGQYNFVAMAHALQRGRSILMLRSYRGKGQNAQSNIVWEFPHATIPRHLRDIVITEYGIADLRSATDEEVIQRMICIADSRWQSQLRQQAVSAGKLGPSWQIPEQFQENVPKWVSDQLRAPRNEGIISDYPFGSDFTAVEQDIARALTYLSERREPFKKKLKLLTSALTSGGNFQSEFQSHLIRMNLEKPSTLQEKLDKRLLCLALTSTSKELRQD